MQINCVSTQREFFETRILKRTFDVVFLDLEKLPKDQTGPLILFGPWHPLGFIMGLRWLSELSYELQHPCIVLPPFESGSLSEAFRLSTSLNVQLANTNHLFTLPEVKQAGFREQRTLIVQTDFTFTGSAGKVWATVGDPLLAALLCVQPKNTTTPMLLCGARLLSASGLSNDEDRLYLLEHIITWAWDWQPIPDSTKKKPNAPVQLDDAIWHVICIVIAGSQLISQKDISVLAGSLFGLEISQADFRLAFTRLADYGLVSSKGDNLELNMKALEDFTQQNGLWAYVRSLRKDFERKDS